MIKNYVAFSNPIQEPYIQIILFKCTSQANCLRSGDAAIALHSFKWTISNTYNPFPTSGTFAKWLVH